MSNYNTCLGIDIGKSEVVVGIYALKSTQSFPNSMAGFKSFFKSYKKICIKLLLFWKQQGDMNSSS